MDQSPSRPATEVARDTKSSPTRNVVDTVRAAPQLTTFAACIEASGLADALNAKGSFTVFAPTDDAFKKLPPGTYDALLRDSGKLKAIMSYHVIKGYFLAREIKQGEVMTLQGSSFTATPTVSELKVNGARVTQPNVLATNGVIHVMDTMILPKNWQLPAAA